MLTLVAAKTNQTTAVIHLTGPRHSGKTSLAKYLIEKILDLDPDVLETRFRMTVSMGKLNDNGIKAITKCCLGNPHRENSSRAEDHRLTRDRLSKGLLRATSESRGYIFTDVVRGQA